MKKKRFSLLAKIVLLTGLLTILTVATSLTANLLISYRQTKDSYVESCESVTDNIESIFASSATDTRGALNIVIEEYAAIRDDYQNKTEEEIADYQKQVRTSLFGPSEGEGFGMTIEKATRKSYYNESISRMQFVCNSYQVPFSSFSLYDVSKQRIIHFMNSNISIDDNFAAIGRLGNASSKKELDFFANGKDFQTITTDNTVYSYNLVNINLDDANYKCFIRAEYPLDTFYKSFNEQLITQLLITIGSAIFLVIIYAIFTKLFLIKNVDRLIDSTNNFVGKMKNDEPLEIVDSGVKTNDEIRHLSDEFVIMQEQIINYVENIKKAQDIEQAFNAEVNIASRIQLESLPAPTHFDKNIELRAFIKPAKGVGGDFYDYFYVDKDHLAVVIADVSGKGIPASLFMMRSKESIRSACMNEKDLAKVLYKVNNSLCVNNKEGYFVTVFLGVLDLKNYEFKYISAGHERPFIKRDNKCERMEVESNFVLGLEEDFEYVEQKVQLQEGDSIVLYTDGLNEAINNNKEEFGYEKIAASLLKEDSLKQNVNALINDLAEFEGEEEQFDDITILSFNIKKNVASYSYMNPTYNDIEDLTAKVEEYLDNLDIAIISKIGVIIDEVMNNVISYGRTKTNKQLVVSIEKSEDGATLIFMDNSHPFNPLTKEKRTAQENIDAGIEGGLGISIVRSISKEVEYTYSNNKNVLIIKF